MIEMYRDFLSQMDVYSDATKLAQKATTAKSTTEKLSVTVSKKVTETETESSVNGQEGSCTPIKYLTELAKKLVSYIVVS